MLDENVKKQLKSWTAFAKVFNQNPKNFKRRILQNIDRLNKWLEPLGLELRLVVKRKSNNVQQWK